MTGRYCRCSLPSVLKEEFGGTSWASRADFCNWPALPPWQRRCCNRALALDYPTEAGAPRRRLSARRLGRHRRTHRCPGADRADGPDLLVDNKPGAGSNLGTESVARAEPDGYTLMADSVSNAINPTLYKKLNYDQLKDLIPVASIDVVPNVMDINLDMPVKTVPEFIAYAKANPGKISMGSGGIGSSPHVAGELFKMMTGVDMLHMPYRGVAPATADLLGGRIAGAVRHPARLDRQHPRRENPRARGDLEEALRLAAGRAGDERVRAGLRGGFVPRHLGAEGHAARDRRQAQCAINAALADTKLKARLAELGAEVFTGTPEDYGRYLAGEIERWAKVIQFSGAKAE